MTISSLYSDYYLPWCIQQNIEPVLEHTYRKMFCSEYNIGFKLTKSDTCKIKKEPERIVANDQELIRLQNELRLHNAKALAMQKKLKLETAVSKKNNRKLVITFDLQKALPLPKLTTGPAFYCRKIWRYNLGIHDCTAGKGHMVLWTENIAKRGSDEVASILLKYLSKITEVDDLIIFTDNCP